MTPADKIAEAMISARILRPYYRRALTALTLVESEDISTMGVDKFWRLYFSPKFVTALTTANLAKVIVLHEVEHLLRNHSERKKERLGRRWNIAADMEINDDTAPGDLPEGVYPENFNLKPGLLTEEYYSLLPEENQFANFCAGGSGIGQKEDWELAADSTSPGVSAEEAERLRDRVAADVREHKKSKPGTVPAGIVVWAEARKTRINPVDWKSCLRRLVTLSVRSVCRGKTDLSFSRLSRRSTETTIRPGTLSYRPKIGIIADTSGSMADLGGEVLAVLAHLRRDIPGIFLEIACDAKAVVKKGKKWTGGGGTDLRPAFTLAAEKKCDLLVVISDCETPWPESRQILTVVAALSGAPSPTWAKRLDIKKQEI